MSPLPEEASAGLWRRALAAFIDWTICALILAGLALILFAATGGRSQMIPSIIPSWCTEVDPASLTLRLPDGFRPNYARSCEYGVLGWPAARILTLTERTVEGNWRSDVNMPLTIDADGMAWATAGEVPGTPTELLLVLFRLLLDAFRRSPSRSIAGIAVVEHATGRRAPFSRLWRRYLIFSIPVGILYLGPLAGLLLVPAQDLSASKVAMILIAAALVSFGILVWIAVSIVRRRPTFYDRPVGTSVAFRQDRP